MSIFKILKKEGFEQYEKMAYGRILERLDSDPEYNKDIFLDLINIDIEVTVFGFLLIKDILLSYMTEEKYEEYLYLLRLHTERAEYGNNIIKLLKNASRKQLKNMLYEVSEGEDDARIDMYVKAELKARSLINIFVLQANSIRFNLVLFYHSIKIKRLLNLTNRQPTT